MTNLREQMAPLLKEFQGANGRGNLLVANTVLIKMVDVLITHIERQTVHMYAMPNTLNAAAAPAVGAGVTYHKTFSLDHTGFVDLSATPPVAGWENMTATTTGDVHKATESMVSLPIESDKEPEKRKPGRPKKR